MFCRFRALTSSFIKAGRGSEFDGDLWRTLISFNVQLTPHAQRTPSQHFSSASPMAVPENPLGDLGLGSQSSLSPDNDEHGKLTPSAVVDRLNRFIIGQVLLNEDGCST